MTTIRCWLNNFILFCVMHFSKKILASILLVSYLFAATGARELLKLPLMVSHFYDHRGEDKQIGVIAFLIMHYSKENGTDEDSKEDTRLPFNSAECATTLVLVSSTPPDATEIQPGSHAVDSKNFCMQPGSFLPSQYLASIWQPPRHC